MSKRKSVASSSDREDSDDELELSLYRSRNHSSDDVSWVDNGLEETEDLSSDDLGEEKEQPFWHVEKRRRRKKSAATSVPKPFVLPEAFYREGDYVPRFQNDYLGRRPMDPAVIRYCARIAKTEARPTTQSIAQSLLNNGEMGASQLVQIKATRHVDNIVEKVQQRLLRETIPERYIKLEEQFFGKSLPHINQQRRKELEGNYKVIQKMGGHLAALEEDHAQIEAKRDRLQQSVAEAWNLDVSSLHPLVQNIKPPPNYNLQQPFVVATATQSRATLPWEKCKFHRPAPEGFLARFLQKLKSPCDEYV